MVVSYVHHALEHRQSRERMTRALTSHVDARDVVSKRLVSEQEYFIRHNLLPKVLEVAQQRWQAAYDAAHVGLAVPLTRPQLIARAAALGVPVTEDNFDTLYKYRPDVRLCRNCCHVEACPHFLRPNRRFNCHIEAERTAPDYPHTLHLVVSRDAAGAPEQLVQQVASRSQAGTRDRPKPPSITSTDLTHLREQVCQLAQAYVAV
ncbi:uncharacterized protein LOC108671683 [Hyalella azteca]|uniref:Uncharacterized protein LOC108671683 n=1 Tax=Hyalella azteca TaxID=294128 RepID=A0A8B7NM41_HYAAZ|nr:uncharacterized protein LOC108671683 [Hyalella azteca]